MKQTNKTILYLIFLAFVCWGRLLYLEGFWGDDWGWVWHYFASDSYSEFIYPYQSLGHSFEGNIMYLFFSLFKYFKADTTLIFNIIRFIFFTLNGILIYSIFKNLMRTKTILSEIIGAVYMVSPLVNMLWTVQIARTIFLFAFLLSILLTIKCFKQERINYFYYISSIILS
ncbi:MAG: hypothetical protein HQK93_10535, partial [Nitrospirae bacterium]|nr:hypothetical protein [Nitrospirota bacterium]